MIFVETFDIDIKRDIKFLNIYFLIYSAVACLFANLIKVNYNNFYKCNISAIENFRLFLTDKIGGFAQVIYCVGVILAMFLLSIICIVLLKVIINKVSKLKKLKN